MSITIMKENYPNGKLILHEVYEYSYLLATVFEKEEKEYLECLYGTLAQAFQESLQDSSISKTEILEISNVDDELYNENTRQQEVNHEIFDMFMNGANTEEVKTLEFISNSIWFFGTLYEYTSTDGSKIPYVTHTEEGGACFLYFLKRYFDNDKDF